MDFQRNNYFNLTELKSRGWTKLKIELWLGKPDETKQNPFYKSSFETKLYLKEKVIIKEENIDFINWMKKTKEKREKISIIQTNKHNIKKMELLEYINNLKIEIPIYSRHKLYSLAVNHYNYLWNSREQFDKNATIKSSNEFLNRISLNMLRHEHKHYEYELEEMFGKTGKIEAYMLLKNKINEEIIKCYPFIKEDTES